MSDTDQLRDRFPDEVYAAEAQFVKLSMKEMTASRMVGWLREYAEYADVAGSDKTADHARHVADALASELPGERPDGDLPTCYECGEELGEGWPHRNQRAEERGDNPADCPHCGENPLPPVGGDSA